MAKSCSVCTHPNRSEIVQTLLERAVTGKPTLVALEKQYKLSRQSITRHVKTCIPASIASAQRVGMIEQGAESAELLAKYVHDAEKIRLACSQWMTDPDDENLFSLEKRSSELMVIYLEGVRNGTPVRRKKTLQELLALVSQKLGIQIVQTEAFGTDPRKLYLDLFRSATALLTLRATLLGEGKEKGEEEQRDWVGFVKEMAQKYAKDELAVARDLWARNESVRSLLEEQWPDLASAKVM